MSLADGYIVCLNESNLIEIHQVRQYTYKAVLIHASGGIAFADSINNTLQLITSLSFYVDIF